MEIGFWIAYGLGLLTGLIIGNKTFRQRFFKSLRDFISQLNRGAKSLNKSYKDKR